MLINTYNAICNLITGMKWVNTLRPIQNGRRFADDTFKRIFLNENVRITIKISLKFVPKGPINNNPALVQIMAWRRPGDKPLSEPMMVRLPTHICVTRPQWVKTLPGNINASPGIYPVHDGQLVETLHLLAIYSLEVTQFIHLRQVTTEHINWTLAPGKCSCNLKMVMFIPNQR